LRLFFSIFSKTTFWTDGVYDFYGSTSVKEKLLQSWRYTVKTLALSSYKAS